MSFVLRMWYTVDEDTVIFWKSLDTCVASLTTQERRVMNDLVGNGGIYSSEVRSGDTMRAAHFETEEATPDAPALSYVLLLCFL